MIVYDNYVYDLANKRSGFLMADNVQSSLHSQDVIRWLRSFDITFHHLTFKTHFCVT